MKIGKYELRIINSGYFKLDGGAMFGIIPKPLWQKTNPSDELNRIQLSTKHLVLISDDRKIIIDTGMGNKWDEKSLKIYDVDENFSLETSLDKIGLKREDITDVILTHLHFDHSGGSTKIENGKLMPAFPNAKYYVQKKNYEWGTETVSRDKGSFIKENFVPLFESGVINFINGNQQIDDEIWVIETNGHTFGQQLVKISDSTNTVLFCADLIPLISHIPLPYIMGYDLQPVITMNEKKEILKKAAEEKWKLFFGHDPDVAIATVKQTDKGVREDKRFKNFDELN